MGATNNTAFLSGKPRICSKSSLSLSVKYVFVYELMPDNNYALTLSFMRTEPSPHNLGRLIMRESRTS